MISRWTFLVLLAVAAIAFAAGRLTVTSPAGFDPGRDLDIGRLTTVLGLSEAQASDLRSLETGYVARVQGACDAHCAARDNLAICLNGDTFDREEARQWVEKMCEAHKANEMATIDQIEKIRSVLTPEQRARFTAMLNRCLCGGDAPGAMAACPASAHTHNEIQEHTK